jgi:hypothetical protein
MGMDGRTDRQRRDEANKRFSKFCERTYEEGQREYKKVVNVITKAKIHLVICLVRTRCCLVCNYQRFEVHTASIIREEPPCFMRSVQNSLLYCNLRGPLMVVQWLRHCGTHQKVAGSIPDGVGIFH